MAGAPTGSVEEQVHRALVRGILFAALLLVVAWFVSAAGLALLVVFVSVVVAVVLNVPVTWMEQHRVPRPLGTILVLLGLAALAAVVGWLIGGRLLAQAGALAEDMPTYASALQGWVQEALRSYPALASRLTSDGASLADAIPPTGELLARVGRYSLSALAFVVFVVTSTAMVVYMLVSPRPLLRALLHVTPPAHRPGMARAFSRSSRMVVGWIWANIVVGAAEAVLVAVALSVIGIPGALVWATLAFFAELVPKLGPYLMAAPPLLIALATDPLDALWVLLFYVVMNELMGDVVSPWVRGQTMQIHPVFLIVAVLVFGSAFGLLGALIATPLAAFIAAFWNEFYLRDRPLDEDSATMCEGMLRREPLEAR